MTIDDEPAWRDHSSGATLQYDFQPPSHWSGERVAAARLALAARIETADPAAPGPGWLRLAAELPAGLRAAIVAELRAGNGLTGIGKGGWPAAGSIVVTMAQRFSVARRALAPGVTWRGLDDPRYAREELSERSGTVEHLVLA